MRRLTPSEGLKVLAAIGVVLLAVVCWAGYKGYNYKKNCTEETRGMITSVNKGSRSLHKRYEVAFEASGNIYTAKGGTHSFDMIHPGEFKAVHYNPNDPTESYGGSMPKEWAYICTYFIYFFILVAIIFVHILLSPKYKKKVNE